ncbi:MAG TPA: NUDIX hydrolase [Vicinamibacteria bacterium]|nr:NUDIX hydrolase [Vicinamibacteria bacterium]
MRIPDPATYRFCPMCAIPLRPRAIEAGGPLRPWCDACGFVAYSNPRLAACAIATVDGGIVLLKRAIEPEKGKWVFPGGFVDRGEEVTAAAIRETREETRLQVGLTGILDAYSFAGQEVVVVVYAAQVLAGRPEAGDEAEAVACFGPEDIPWGDLAFDATRAALRDYLRRYFPGVRVPGGAG